MNIKTLILGDLDTNCYILEKDGKQLIVDPADNIDEINKHLTNLVGILITHYHFDHIGALEQLQKQSNAPVYDYKTLGTYKIDGFELDIIDVKGHHDTCVMFDFKDKMFVGDFIFENGIGRTDLETGNYNLMIESLKKLENYTNRHIYSGHGNDFYI